MNIIFMTAKRIIRTVILCLGLIGIWEVAEGHPAEVEPKSQVKEDRLQGSEIRPQEPYDEYIRYVNEVYEAVSEEMFKQMGLVCEGDKGQMHDKVEQMGLRFRAHRHATIEEARAMHVFVLEKLVDAINAHERLQPFLEERPFTYKRVSVQISFKGLGEPCFEGHVAWLFNVANLAEHHNRLCYYSIDSFKGESSDLFEEPYKTAIELAKAFPPERLALHETQSVEEITSHVLSAFNRKMKKEYRLLSLSIGGKLTDTVDQIGANFQLAKHATQEEARQWILVITDELIGELNNNELLRPYLKEHPFPIERIKMRISFTKPNGYRYSDGSIERVAIEGNEVSYFGEPLIESDSSPMRVDLLAKESYQEAKEKPQASIEDFIPYLYEVYDTVALQVYKETGLVCIGFQHEIYDKVEGVVLKFKVPRIATIKEARALHVFVLEKLVGEINAHEKLRPFLKESPFTYKQVTVAIGFDGAALSWFDDTVALLYNATIPTEEDHCLCYLYDDFFERETIDFFKEPYTAAIEIIKASSPQNLTTHQVTPLEEAMNGLLPVFAEKMEKEHQFKYCCLGGKLTDSIEGVDVSFSLDKFVTLEQARELLLLMTDSLLFEINHSKQLKPYLKEDPFPIDRLRVRLKFAKRDGVNDSEEHLDRVILEDGQIRYMQDLLPKWMTYQVEIPPFATESYEEGKELNCNRPSIESSSHG